MSHLATALSLIVLATSVAAVPAAGPGQGVEHQTLDAFGVKTTSCHEWTDQCAVCLRRDDGAFGCSLPGIACQPGPIACRDAKTPADAPGRPN